MHTSTGTVIEIVGKRAVVACAGAGHCARCDAGNGCGGALMSRLLGDRLRTVEAKLPGHLHVHTGDTVTLELSDDGLLRAAAIVYLVPLCGLLLGASLIAAIWPSGGDAGGLLGAGAGLLTGLGLARLLALGAERRPGLTPVIVAQGRPGAR